MDFDQEQELMHLLMLVGLSWKLEVEVLSIICHNMKNKNIHHLNNNLKESNGVMLRRNLQLH
jgi:hypothetical protein